MMWSLTSLTPAKDDIAKHPPLYLLENYFTSFSRFFAKLNDGASYNFCGNLPFWFKGTATPVEDRVGTRHIDRQRPPSDPRGRTIHPKARTRAGA